MAVGIGRNGDVYVADRDSYRIKVYSSAGLLLRHWGGFGTDSGRFVLPEGIALDAGDNVYVTDKGLGLIQKFTSSGEFITSWSSGKGGGPRGIVVSGGYVYVVANRIIKFTQEGGFVDAWGYYPDILANQHIAADAAGALYVGDPLHDRVVKFTGDGKLLTSWGSGVSGACDFDCPSGIAVDPAGNIYVADPCEGNPRPDHACIQKFGRDITPAVRRTWGSLKVIYR